MAQNSKDAQKRTSRAERRAAEAAAMKARAEQMEKERKQQTIIGGIVVAVLVILVAIGAFTVYHNMHKKAETKASTETVQEAYTALQKVKNTPKLVDKKGGLLISKNGYGKAAEGAPTVELYMDFLCPGCGNLHRQLDADLQKMVDAGQINLDLHFMAFMDRWSTDEYSSRAANAAIYLAEHDSDPNHLISFLEKVYAEDFQPEEGSAYKSVSDAKIKEQMLAANNLAIEGKPEDLVINTHVCRGNFHSTYASSGAYDSVAKTLLARENVTAYYLEFDDARSGGFEPLAAVSGEKKVVLGLVTTKRPELEDKAAVIARIHDAAKYIPIDRLCLSPQCGFASCEIGNKLTEAQQWAKLALVKEIAEEVWG